MSLYFNAKESQDAPASSKPRRGGKNGLGKTKGVKIRQMEVRKGKGKGTGGGRGVR